MAAALLFNIAVLGTYAAFLSFSMVAASLLSGTSIHDNAFLGIAIGLAIGSGTDLAAVRSAHDDRWLQLPVATVVGVIVALSICISGTGVLTTLGFASGFGYAMGPFLSQEFTAFGIGVGFAVFYTAAVFASIHLCTRHAARKAVEESKHRKPAW